MTVVIITGGGGFLGQSLASCILKARCKIQVQACAGESGSDDNTVSHIVLADVAFPPVEEMQPSVAQAVADGVVTCRTGSVASREYCDSLLRMSSGSVSIFHLSAVMSGQGEANFDLCMDVNLRGTMHMLEAARAHSQSQSGRVVKFVYASAGATIGSGAPQDWIQKEDVITDSTRATPHTSYGMTKAVGELLLADYSRRNFVDGRGARLPTVVVRAGAPNAATTSCFSGVVREPLAGVEAVMPIAPDVKHAVTGVANVVHALRKLHDVPSETMDAILGFDRTVFLPATALSLSELEAATRKVVDPSCHHALGKVKYEADAFLSDVVGGFPTKIDATRALQIGCLPAPTAEELVRSYVETFPDALADGIQIVPRRDRNTTSACTEDKRTDAEGSAKTTSLSCPPSSSSSSGASTNNIVACLTGAGTGIGRAVAVRLAQGGWGLREEEGPSANNPRVCLVLIGRRREPLQETAALAEKYGAICQVAPCDVTNEGCVKATFASAKAAFGRVDLLFNNAGTNIGATSVVDFSSTDFRRIIDANLTGSFLCAREAMRMMKDQVPMGGRIINNGSISAQVPRPGGVAYTCSKFGVSGLTRTLALEGRAHNIPVGQIDFGNVTTAVSAITQSGAGALQPDGTSMVEPQFFAAHAANTVHAMAALPLEANALDMTVLATNMPFVGRG